MELPNDIWLKIVDNSKKTINEYIKDVNEYKDLENIRNLLNLHENELLTRKSINTYDIVKIDGENGYYLVEQRRKPYTKWVVLTKLITTDKQTSIMNFDFWNGVEIADPDFHQMITYSICINILNTKIIEHIKYSDLQIKNINIAINLQKNDIIQIANFPYYHSNRHDKSLSTSYYIFQYYCYNNKKEISSILVFNMYNQNIESRFGKSVLPMIVKKLNINEMDRTTREYNAFAIYFEKI
jgi:uncharacterized protein (DUF39 family)